MQLGDLLHLSDQLAELVLQKLLRWCRAGWQAAPSCLTVRVTLPTSPHMSLSGPCYEASFTGADQHEQRQSNQSGLTE